VAYLSDNDATYLRERFAELLTHPVRMHLFTEPASGLYVPGRRSCETCADMEALTQEVAGLSDQITLEIINVPADPETARQWGVTLVPTLAVDGGTDAGVRFVGLPDGYEFGSLVETLIAAGSDNGYGLQPETLEQLASLPEPVEIKTFVTPT
jgi:alkyl hydroperoxide reductase subunit AhpF